MEDEGIQCTSFHSRYVEVISSIETLHCLLLRANLQVVPTNNAINSDVRKCGNLKTYDDKNVCLHDMCLAVLTTAVRSLRTRQQYKNGLIEELRNT